MKPSLFLLAGALVLASAFNSFADTMPLKKKVKMPAPAVHEEKEWSLETGSGLLIGNVRTTDTGAMLVPAELTASLKLDDDSLDNVCGGVFRGHTEWVFRGFGMAVAHGIESRFVGANFGPRYNFVQPGWVVVPFVEGNVGFAFTDSQGYTDPVKGQQGQGQDFNFNFGIGTGIRYDITPSWFMRVAGVYTHFSNAGLSEPGRKNRALDAAGPMLTFGYRF